MIDFNSVNIRTWSRLGTCGAYGIAANELAKINDKIVFLTSDLCFYSGLSRFSQEHPDKLYNVGIAENNMVGIAAGFAKEGFIPFASTYATFASMRCADQVRVNMGYMKLPIKLVGLTAGLSVGILGSTHIAIEDIATMRSIPNIDILSPADCAEAVKAIIESSKNERPTYIRLTGSMTNPSVYTDDFEYKIGKAIKLKEGNDISIIATGTMVYLGLKVADALLKKNINAEVIDMHTIKPIDVETIVHSSKKSLIVTIEEHSIIGGLGSAVNDELQKNCLNTKTLNIGISDNFTHAGDYNYLLDKYGLTVEKITNKIFDKVKLI